MLINMLPIHALYLQTCSLTTGYIATPILLALTEKFGEFVIRCTALDSASVLSSVKKHFGFLYWMVLVCLFVLAMELTLYSHIKFSH